MISPEPEQPRRRTSSLRGKSSVRGKGHLPRTERSSGAGVTILSRREMIKNLSLRSRTLRLKLRLRSNGAVYPVKFALRDGKVIRGSDRLPISEETWRFT